MPREGVAFEQVAAAAEALVSEGRVASIRAVRERLAGRGSPNTIHRHLSAWRAQRPPGEESSVALPPAIAREVQQAIARATDEARRELEAQLTEARSELEELATVGEALEAERDQLRAELAVLARERDQLTDRAAERAATIARLDEEGGRARTASEKARVALAEARFEVGALRQQLDAQQAECVRLREVLREERRQRAEAERVAAGHEARTAALHERVSELLERDQAAQREVHEARARLEKLSETERVASGECMRLSEELKSARSEVARTTAEITRLREARVNLRAEVQARALALQRSSEALHASALERARLVGQLEALGRTQGASGHSEQAVGGVVAE